MTAHVPGPGVRWLAGRTGKDPGELTASPAAAVAALSDAVRQVAALAARAESADPRVRADALAEASALRDQFASAPPALETLLARVAAAMTTAAERVKREG